MHAPSRPLSVAIAPLAEHHQIQRRWQALEQHSDRSFFLSWAWIGTWLTRRKTPPFLIAVQDEQGEDIALGLVCTYTQTRNKIIIARQLILHATGDQGEDVITIEYNNLLMRRGYEDKIWVKVLEALTQDQSLEWDELIIPGTTPALKDQLIPLMANQYLRTHASSARVDLNQLRRAGAISRADILTHFSKNTRNQIKRSVKLYERMGPLTLTRAQTPQEVNAFFDQTCTLHIEKWKNLDQPSGVASEPYRAFHEKMIMEAHAAGQIELLCAHAGDHQFGWLYNFVDRGKVLFYLSGFVAEPDNKLKPGLVTHLLAIENHLKHGNAIYDFMGGNDRYKKSLGTPGPDIMGLVLQRRRPLLMAEHLGRRLRERLKSKK